MKKLSWVLLLALVLLLGVIPAASARADDVDYEVDGGYIYFDTDSGEITGWDGDITAVVIPDTINGVAVTGIADSAFEYCYSLTSVTIPASVTSIGDYAFADCDSLSSLTISDGVESIGEWAFNWCRNLNSVTVPASVTYIGFRAFGGCNSLTAIDVDSENAEYSSIDGVLFNRDTTELILYPRGKRGAYTIPNGVTTIDEMAFTDCFNLTKVTIPDSVESIGERAFENTGLTSVTIPASVNEIGEGVFDYCRYLTAIDVEDDNLRYSSQSGVLLNKDGDELICCPPGKSGSFVIPSGVTSIGRNAFYSCNSLTSINIPGSVINIEEWAFEGCDSLTAIDVDSENAECSSIDGVLFNKEATELILYPRGKRGAYTIPDGVIVIDYMAFTDCFNLTKVTIPDSVESIGERAFENTDLTSVTIPKSVTEIGARAFSYCWVLTAINVDEENPLYSSQSGVLFNKEGDELICFPSGKSSTFDIPSGVTSIDDFAFYGCDSLTTVTIPASVTNIEEYAFCRCYSLADVYYTGNEEQWDEIEIGEENRPLLNAVIHYNYIENHLSVAVDKSKGNWQDGELHVAYGGTAELNVIASADEGELSYRWVHLCEGDEIIDEELGDGAAQTITNVTNDGLYVCYVTDKYGTVRHAAICVRVDDDFSIQADGPSAYRFSASSRPQQVTFGVEVNSSCMSDISYRWRQEYYNEDEGYFTWKDLPWDSSSHTIEAYQTATYMCIARRAVYDYDYVLSDGDIFVDYYSEDRVYFYIDFDNGFSAFFESDLGTWDGQFLYLSPEEAVEGVTLTVMASADDGDGITYKWYKSGIDENGYGFEIPLTEYENETTLTTGPVTNYYTYSCLVGDKYGNYHELSAGVGVDNQFSAQAKGDTTVLVQPGESATLEVDAFAADMNGISYSWSSIEYFYGDMAYWAGGERIYYLNNSPVLETEPVYNCGLYLCEVRDRFGNTTWVNFEVAVDNDFSAVAHGTNSTFKEIEVYPAGEDVQLKVVAEANESDGIKYNWYSFKPFRDKYGNCYPAATGTDIVLVDGSGDNDTMAVENVTKSKWYFSRVMDKFANIIYVIFHVKVDNNLTVTPDPDTPTEEEENILIPSGTDQRLAVIANATDMEGLKYVWAKGQYNERASFWGWADGFGTESFLELEDVTVPASYRCMVTDQYDNSVWTVFNISLTYDGGDNDVQVKVAPGAMDDDVDFIRFVAELTEAAPAPDDAVVYDLYFEDENGDHLQPKDEVTVSIPVPEEMNGEECKVYYIAENGTTTDMNAVYDADNSALTFTTDHFSYYAVVEMSYLPGDINGDGVVNNKDVTRLMRYIKYNDVPVVEAALDVNGDGKVNNKDVTRLMRFIKYGDVDIY